MDVENEGDPTKYFDEDDRLVKFEMYDGPINTDALGVPAGGGQTMGELRERLVPYDHVDRLDRVILPITLIGVAFGIMLIMQSI